MTIKIITCHDVYNHGASLQAFALLRYLNSLGYEVEIIDYKPDYLSGHYKLCSVNNPVYNKPIIKQLYIMVKLPGRMLHLRRKKIFDEFTKNNLKLTAKRYHSNEELKSDPPHADFYIAGSDQIWNTMFQNGRDPAFYLDFAPKNAKRISYAASFATDDIAEEYKPFVRKMLEKLDKISIREKISLPLLKKMGRPDGVAVCDPIFLLSKEQWEQMFSKSSTIEKYVLVYDSEKSLILKQIAKSIAKDTGFKIYNVSSSEIGYADKDLWASSPLDFIRLIYEAQYVVSNSFHATAFSIIFERDFCVVNRAEKINKRMKSLLMGYGLSKRLVQDYSSELLDHIDYTNVRPLMIQDIDDSMQFLHNALK